MAEDSDLVVILVSFHLTSPHLYSAPNHYRCCASGEIVFLKSLHIEIGAHRMSSQSDFGLVVQPGLTGCEPAEVTCFGWFCPLKTHPNQHLKVMPDISKCR